MKIVTLIENGKLDLPDIKSEHGMCLYIETQNHKILFDLGESNTFLKNAQALGVNIKEIDTVIISHGHRDHGGGLKTFLEENERAKIYLKKEALDNHYAGIWKLKFNCGLDTKMIGQYQERFVLIEDDYEIDENLMVIGRIHNKHDRPSTNSNLYVKKENKIIQDVFDHELILKIKDRDKMFAFSGCGHSGILNIVDTLLEYHENEGIILFSGFHLANPLGVKKADQQEVETIGQALVDKPSLEKIYTGHCTGEKAYDILEKIMDDKLDKFTTGKTIVFQ